MCTLWIKTEGAIAHCRERFAEDRHISAHVNDGTSLAMVADESIDLVFSFDADGGARSAQADREPSPGAFRRRSQPRGARETAVKRPVRDHQSSRARLKEAARPLPRQARLRGDT
jgi:hypothetical protein